MTSWGPLKFGEKCDRHPPMKTRGLDSRTTILKQINPITGQEMMSDTTGSRANQRAIVSSSDSWYKHHYHDPLASTAVVGRKTLEEASAHQQPAGVRNSYFQQPYAQQAQQQRQQPSYDDDDFGSRRGVTEAAAGAVGSRFRNVVNGAVQARAQSSNPNGNGPRGSIFGAPSSLTTDYTSSSRSYGNRFPAQQHQQQSAQQQVPAFSGRVAVNSLNLGDDDDYLSRPDSSSDPMSSQQQQQQQRRPGMDALPYTSDAPAAIRDTTVQRVGVSGDRQVPSLRSVGALALESIRKERALRRQLAEAARSSRLVAQGRDLPLSLEERLERRVDVLLQQIRSKVDSVSGPNGDSYQVRQAVRKIISQHMFISGCHLQSPSGGGGGRNGDGDHLYNRVPRARGGWGAEGDGQQQQGGSISSSRLRLAGPSSDTSDPSTSLDLQQLRRVLERGFGIVQLSDDDCQAIFDRFDINEDGILSLNELCWGFVFGCSTASLSTTHTMSGGVTGTNQIINPGARDAILRIKKRIIQRFVIANAHTDDANLFNTGHMRRITQSLRNVSIFPLTRVRMAHMPAGVNLSTTTRHASTGGDSVYSYLLQQQQQLGINADGTLSVITAVDLLNGLQKIGVPQVSMADVEDIINSLAPAPTAVMNAEGAFFIPVDGAPNRGTLSSSRGANVVIQGVTPQRLIKAFRGVLPRRRRAIIAQAFNQLDVDGNGYIALSEIIDRFDAERHPAVLSGDATKEDVVKQFMMNWKTSVALPEDVPPEPINTRYGGAAALQARQQRDGGGVASMMGGGGSWAAADRLIRSRSVSDVANEVFAEASSTHISWREFLNYYKDLGDEIVSDDYFVFMMRNVWHLSSNEGDDGVGGYRDLTNTTCKRVLVSYMDGSQRVEEIKNDLGLRNGDMPEIRRRLEQQGHRGIKEVALYN